MATRVTRRPEKENVDTRNCFKCFYQWELIFLMAWVLASFILQITYLTEANDIIRSMEEVEQA